VLQHANPVTEQSATGNGAGWINGYHTTCSPFPAQFPDQSIDQRRLSGTPRTRDTDNMRTPDMRANRQHQFLTDICLVFNV
jgi:hypothetical protein